MAPTINQRITDSGNPKRRIVLTLFSSISENHAEGLYWGGQVLLVIAAIAGAVGAGAMIVGDRARDRFSNMQMSENNRRMSENELKTASAEKEAAIANQRAAEAEQRAAEANAKAEKERVERLKIEERLSPSMLSLRQRQMITDAAAGLGYNYALLRLVCQDSETLELQANITIALGRRVAC